MTSTGSKDGELSLREIQLASLEILKRIDEICRKEGFRYWLAYGTLIGAVRHGGFIPWDDDLDIMMPRPDYEAFLKYCDSHKEQLQPLVALHNTSERKLPFLITRVSDTRFKMIGEAGCDVPEMGAFIDVYPLDGLGDDYNQAVELKAKCRNMTIPYCRAGNFQMMNAKTPRWKRVAKAAYSLLHGQQVAKAETAQATLLALHEYEESVYVDAASWGQAGREPFVYKRADFESVSCVFEGISMPIPKGFDAVLSVNYGDYMSLPPFEERVGKHSYKIIRRD